MSEVPPSTMPNGRQAGSSLLSSRGYSASVQGVTCDSSVFRQNPVVSVNYMTASFFLFLDLSWNQNQIQRQENPCLLRKSHRALQKTLKKNLPLKNIQVRPKILPRSPPYDLQDCRRRNTAPGVLGCLYLHKAEEARKWQPFLGHSWILMTATGAGGGGPPSHLGAHRVPRKGLGHGTPVGWELGT